MSDTVTVTLTPNTVSISEGFSLGSAFSAKGQILVGTASGTYTALTVGTDGYVLTADSSTASGVKWAAASGGGGSVSDGDKGDIVVSSSGTVWTIDSGWTGGTGITTLGTITTGTWSATAIGPTKGGTGLTSYTLGDILYASGANTLAVLAGNTTSTRKFLRQTGASPNSAAPTWDTLVAGDIPDLSATYQPLDSDLTAYAALSSTGLVARTGSGTVSARTITSGGGLSVTNGDGVSGNPTISTEYPPQLAWAGWGA